MTTLIRRDELIQMLSEWKSGVLGGKNAHRIAGRGTVLLLNQGPDILSGLPLAVKGRMFPNVTEDQAITEYLTYGVQLRGDTPSDETSDQIIAITAEPIYSGRVGRVWLGGVIGASVSVSDNSHGYVKCNFSGLFSSDEGPFRLVAHVGSFAFIMPSGLLSIEQSSDDHSSNEQTSGGHLIGTITAVNGSDYTIDVGGVDYNANSPLGVLESGTRVAIDQSRSGNWNIISAECPEEEASNE